MDNNTWSVPPISDWRIQNVTSFGNKLGPLFKLFWDGMETQCFLRNEYDDFEFEVRRERDSRYWMVASTDLRSNETVYYEINAENVLTDEECEGTVYLLLSMA